MTRKQSKDFTLQPKITKDQAWGRSELMVIAAFRYCLGRQTYITSDCADWLISVWDELSPNNKYVIKRDLEQAFDDHEKGLGFNPLGQECDKVEWGRVRKLWYTPSV